MFYNCIVFSFFLLQNVVSQAGCSSTSSSRQPDNTGLQQRSAMDTILSVNNRLDDLPSKEHVDKKNEIGENILEANNVTKVVANLWEGDIILDENNVEDAELLKMSKHYESDSQEVLHKRQATRNMKWLWHAKQVPYIISPSLETVKPTILNAIRTFNSKTCVQFVPKRGSEKNYILFDKRQGCYSRIGRAYNREGSQVISIGDYCDHLGVIIHEMLHSVGFYHEQSRPDRDQSIAIHWENVKPGFRDQFQLYDHGAIDGLDLNYNYNSLMHYGKTAFSKSPGLTTIEAIGNINTKLGNTDMSPQDIIELDALYSCKTNKFNTWTSWSSFTPCDAKCYKNRQRFCYGKKPTSCGGKPNSYGIEREYIKCSSQECPAKIDGGWGTWSPWQPCSMTCDDGVRSRKRACNNPAPQNNGKKCEGVDTQEQMCTLSTRCHLGAADTDFNTMSFGIWENGIYDTPGPKWVLEKKSKADPPDYYLYVQPSIKSEKLENEVVRLNSKMLQSSPDRMECLKFSYKIYMPSSTAGSLSVKLKPTEGASTIIFLQKGNQGNEWKSSQVTLDTYSNYQLTFEAAKHRIPGRSSYSKVAVDDIFIDRGSCDCQDEFRATCEVWAKTGKCKQNADFMLRYCKRSCKLCQRKPGCRDVYVKENRCESWAKFGFCTHTGSVPWMSLNCRKSCKYCDCNDKIGFAKCKPLVDAKKCKTDMKSMITNCKLNCGFCDCKDRAGNSHCNKWAAEGECEINPEYMQLNCRQSCGLCYCRDENVLCESWMLHGECTKNPKFMWNDCALSCGKCK